MTNNQINDGGSAFPHADRVDQNGETVFGASGMSLRDYFMAHAPSEPQPWFKPVLPPRPTQSACLRWCDGCLAGGCCIGDADCEKLMAEICARSEWDALRDKLRYTQWPSAWADALLAERNKQNEK